MARKKDLSALSERELEDDYKNRMLNLLSRQKTEKEVREYLKKQQCPDAMAERLIQFALDYRFINDEHYARCFIRDASELKHHSVRRIRYDLAMKGLSKDLIEEALADVSPDDGAAIDYLVTHRLKSTEEAEIEKFKNRLASAGFSYGDIACALDK